MINELKTIGYCCEDIQNIENYDAAVADNSQKWVCHHRNEITLGLSSEQLIRKHLYYERPASELIFLTNSEHTRLHNLNLTEERRSNQRAGVIAYHETHECPQSKRDKISANMKARYASGESPWNKGKHMHSEEMKQHLSDMQKKRWTDPEYREKCLAGRKKYLESRKPK